MTDKEVTQDSAGMSAAVVASGALGHARLFATQAEAGMFYALSLPLLLYYYFGPQRVYTLAVYLAALLVVVNTLLTTGRIKKVQLYLCVSLLTLLSISFFTFTAFLPALFALRLNFGLFILMLAYASLPLPRINALATFLSIWTIGEYLLIRLMPQLIFTLPNYFMSTFALHQAQGLLGGVHSFGANRSNSAVLLLTLFVFLEGIDPRRRFRYLPLVASLLCESGTAYLLLFVYLLIKYRSKLLPMSLVCAGLAFVLLYTKSDGYFLTGRFNSPYLFFLWDYKYTQIVDYWNNTQPYGIIFGRGSGAFATISAEIGGYGASYGDFIFLDFVTRFGLVGVVILFTLAIKFSRNVTRVPIWFLIVGTFHYPILFSAPGQVVGAYLFIAGLRMQPFRRDHLGQTLGSRWSRVGTPAASAIS